MHVSASQIELFKACPRKWGFKYIEQEPSEGDLSASLAIGSAVHSILEAYLLEGKEPDLDILEGAIAAKGLHILDRYTDLDFLVEHSLEEMVAPETAIPFKGFIDLYIMKDRDGIPHILDHKTSSSISKWAKTETELMTNTQLIIYAKFALLNDLEAESVRLSHIYYQTKAPFQSKQVTVELTRNEVDKQFSEIAKTIEEMAKAHSTNKPNTLSRKKNYCNAFFKDCEYLAVCQEKEKETVSPQQKNIFAFLQSDDEDLVFTNKIEEPKVVEPKIEEPKVVEPKIEEPKVEESKIEEPKRQGKTLYIGCRPLQTEVKDFSSFVYQFEFDLTQGRTYGSVPFGQGWESLIQKLRSVEIPAGSYFLSMQGTLYSKLADILPSLFDTLVVREG